MEVTSVAECVLVSIQSYLRVLYAIKDTLQEGNGGDRELVAILNEVSSLLRDLEEIYARWGCIEAGVGSGAVEFLYRAPRVKYGTGRGRPTVVIEQEKIVFLRELRFTWTQIAAIFGVCCRTLYTMRSNYGMLGDEHARFTGISDQELCDLVRSIKQDMPEIGYNMMRGVLRSRGIHVSIPRIQQCISDVDPVNTALRWAAPTSRRRYGVPHPNFIWHIDGNHNLVRWRIVVHGGIDGYSRLIVFLKCSDNNRSSTVLQLFQTGVRHYGLPERIRTDRGGENVQVVEYMLAHSTASSPVLVGSSVHNVRIERLWRDTFRCVLSVFYQLFYYLEECGKLDPLSEKDLFCLHFVYIPRIANALDVFRCGWNNHAITTEHCKTPVQLFTSGSLLRGPQPDYSHEDVGGTCTSLDVTGVVVPAMSSPLSPSQENELRCSVDPLQMSENYGIELYDTVRQFVLDRITIQ